MLLLQAGSSGIGAWGIIILLSILITLIYSAIARKKEDNDL
ncbi:hypothetical protein ACQCN2_18680 [Brevibacillus ginsengisoli]